MSDRDRRATIFARSSGSGISGVAVLRLSGPQAVAATRGLITGSWMEPRQASLRYLRDPETGETIDQALLLWFPAPASFTGEDVVEIQCHGSRAVLADLYRILSRHPGCRPADPGEFTRRAFDNGRMDLTQVEALSDLLEAETAAQRRQAVHQISGALGQIYDGWRDRLVRCLAHVEAEIDFPEEDLPEDMLAPVREAVRLLQQEMNRHLDDGRRGERRREGFRLAIVGEPNVGKSRLLNALAQREAAIVSEIAGTTRDVIEVHLDLAGFPVMLADTAGLRETSDPVEREGVLRSRQRIAEADLVLHVFDARGGLPAEKIEANDIPALLIANKTDLLADPGKRQAGIISLSAVTGEGIAELLQAIIGRLDLDRSSEAEDTPLTRARHRQALELALVCLDRFQT
ncbi:MAG: tRNA uridine-5-carboxymethylaminomethyl(34) synthesis GTPase MnmE, partial [Rhodospirillales bacterium]